MLEEIQVAVALEDGVMHRMRADYSWVREAGACNEVDLDRQPLGDNVEIDAAHDPRIADTQCGFKQFALHHFSSSCLQRTGQYHPIQN